MAEDMAPAPGGRHIIMVATVVTVVFFTLFVMGLRSCSTEQGAEKAKLPSHVVIYSNLNLKDSALVIARLKEMRIPYEIRDEGRAVAVPRGRADEARLGLAEKNLPAGGTVGWEIFDQTKLGATDFDRRIQFIRALSGELSRTINRISAVDDARVQIVIPETKLFEVSKAPVTASVLLKLKPGEALSPKQVNAVMYLVAGSVENLKPENITIVDTNGNMLSGAEYAPARAEESAPAAEEKVVVEKEEEKAALGVQAKLDLENTLTSKAQSLLNRLYPPNVAIIRVNVDSIQTRKTTAIILVDKKFKISPVLKKNTFETVSALIGYDRSRGDRIILKSVPFRAAVAPASPAVSGANKIAAYALPLLKAVYRKYGRESAVLIGVLFILVLLSLFGLFGRRKKELPSEEVREEAGEEEIPIVEHMKELASKNPELAAQLIRSWVREEGA